MRQTWRVLSNSFTLTPRLRLTLLFLIVLLGGLLRFWHFTDLPTGLHGDEGIVGYEARRILRDGSIGPYSPASNGQPSGPIYLVAPVLALFGNQMFTVRFIPALVGTLTIVALWGLMRRFGTEKTALLGAFVLATLLWHIHYARIAFPLESWPFFCILIAWTTLKAIEKPQWQWWALAGFTNGFGAYIYKAHPFLFFPTTLLFATVYLVRSGVPWPRKIAFLALYLVAALVAASFFIRYARDPDHGYWNQFDLYSVFKHLDAYTVLTSPWDKTLLLIGRYFGFWRDILFCPASPDYVDAAGLVPMVSLPVFGLALIGLISASRRDPLTNYSRLIVLLMPLANVITFDAFARRSFCLVPFLCVLAAVGGSQLVRWGRARSAYGEKWVSLALASCLAFTLCSTIKLYFFDFAANETQNWIFCDELTRSIEYMKTLPPSRPIYFYSERWSITYDTRKFLAPELHVLDRSREYGPDVASFDPFPGEQLNRPVWVLLGAYRPALEELKMRFPGGKTIEGPFSASAHGPSFIAYESP